MLLVVADISFIFFADGDEGVRQGHGGQYEDEDNSTQKTWIDCDSPVVCWVFQEA